LVADSRTLHRPRRLAKDDQFIDPVDEVRSYVGMRKISLGKEKGITRILLNGKPCSSTARSTRFWPDASTPPTDEALATI